MLDEQRLIDTVDTFHQVASTQRRESGTTMTTLVYLPECGEPIAAILLGNQPPTAQRLARKAREFKASALILISEYRSTPSDSVRALPPANRPWPSRSPENFPVIVTVAVRADGHTVLRETRITTGAFGCALTSGDLKRVAPRVHTLVALLQQALSLANRG